MLGPQILYLAMQNAPGVLDARTPLELSRPSKSYADAGSPNAFLAMQNAPGLLGARSRLKLS
jgi:hypothetical protein